MRWNELRRWSLGLRPEWRISGSFKPATKLIKVKLSSVKNTALPPPFLPSVFASLRAMRVIALQLTIKIINNTPFEPMISAVAFSFASLGFGTMHRITQFLLQDTYCLLTVGDWHSINFSSKNNKLFSELWTQCRDIKSINENPL